MDDAEAQKERKRLRKEKRRKKKAEAAAAEVADSAGVEEKGADAGKEEPVPDLDWEAIKTATSLNKLRQLDPDVDGVIGVLTDTSLFDDAGSENNEIHVTVKDLVAIVLAGKGSLFVTQKLAEWEGMNRRFSAISQVSEALGNVRAGRPDKMTFAKKTSKRTLEELKQKDPFVDKVMQKLSNCRLFDHVANNSLNVSVDDLWNLIAAGKTGKLVVRILNMLEKQSARLSDFDSLVSKVRSLRKVARQEAKEERERERQADEAARKTEELKLIQLRKMLTQDSAAAAGSSATKNYRATKPYGNAGGGGGHKLLALDASPKPGDTFKATGTNFPAVMSARSPAPPNNFGSTMRGNLTAR